MLAQCPQKDDAHQLPFDSQVTFAPPKSAAAQIMDCGLGQARPRRPTRRISCLADLGLTEQDYGALAQQGFVSHEYRGIAGPYYKLRFRLAGQQCTRYLGSDQPRGRGNQARAGSVAAYTGFGTPVPAGASP